MPTMAKRKKTPEDPPAERSTNGQGAAAGPNRSPHRAVFIRMDLDLSASLDQFLASLDVEPTIKEAVQVLLREALAARGHYPPRQPTQEGGAS